MGVVIRLETELTDEERRTLFEWGEDIFGVRDKQFRWRPKDWHFLVEADGRVTTHVGVIKHTVRAGGREVTVGGIGGVVTVPEAQGNGLAQRAMRHAAEFMCDELQVEFGMLFCEDRLVPFYARLGWRKVEDEVEFEQEAGPVVSPFNVMVLPCGEGREWPAGRVEIGGLPW
ncbi:MAG TPA: GNAT family N-acetyltransferase [Pyrinomonadaceae bacterium]|nr:GNAT family N-acetyltransferase [Pyrinomonadaceae bacterium]